VTDTPFDSFALVGTVLEGQYRVDDVVGEGGFGVVYKGWHLSFDQPIAIKALKIPDAGDAQLRSSVLAKFHEEAKLCYVLSQRSLNIVRSIAFGALTTPSGIWAPFLILEWLEGRSLAADFEDRHARGMPGRSLGEAIALLEPAARGLAYAHSKRVAHRDVKPANMFLTTLPGSPPQETIKVLDFGIAKIVAEGATPASLPLQATGFSSFTPFYAAPEQLDPRLGMTGPWTDVYSLAIVLTEALEGHPATEGDVMALVRRATDPVRRPTPRAGGVQLSDAVEAVFLRALAVDPKERFAEAGAFWDALVAAGRDRPSMRAWAAPAVSVSLSDSSGSGRTTTAAMPVVSSKLPTTTARMVPPASASAPPETGSTHLRAAPDASRSPSTAPMAAVPNPSPFAPTAAPAADTRSPDWGSASGSRNAATPPPGGWGSASGSGNAATPPPGGWGSASGSRNAATPPPGGWGSASGSMNAAVPPPGGWAPQHARPSAPMAPYPGPPHGPLAGAPPSMSPTAVGLIVGAALIALVVGLMALLFAARMLQSCG